MNLRKLIEAIGKAWDAGEIGVPLHYGTMPERAALPAVTFNCISNIPTGAGMSAVPEGVLVQFSVYSDSESVGECIDIRDKLRAAFDNVTLTIDDATLIRGDWQNEVGPVSDPDEGWDCHIDYRFLVQSV